MSADLTLDLCWCGGNPIVGHRRGVDGCRYSPAASALLSSVEEYTRAVPATAGTLTPVAKRWQPAGLGVPPELLDPLGRFMEAGTASG